jgi:lysophospholipase L1-like esterase
MDKIKTHRKALQPVFLLSLFLIISVVSHAQKFSFITKLVNRVQVGERYEYPFLAEDSAGKKITYSCDLLPDWISFDKTKNMLFGVAAKPGQYAVQISAATTDTIIKQNFMLTVYNKQTINILPLGNSITNGTSVYNSYRRSLWQMLHQANYNFDFIGSWDKQHMGAAYPIPDFDLDNDGHSGWTAHHLLEPPDWDKQRGNLDLWLKSYIPDVVLMELGTNEVFQCTDGAIAMNDLSIIIDKLRLNNGSVKILLAQIPPLGKKWAPQKLCGNDISYEQAIKLFNPAVLQFAESKTTSESPVIIVDQFTGINPDTDMYDDIHPNEIGEKKMAERWFNAMKPFLKKLN